MLDQASASVECEGWERSERFWGREERKGDRKKRMREIMGRVRVLEKSLKICFQ